MRTQKRLFLPAVIAGVLWCSILFGADTSLPAGQSLADIRELNVFIEYPEDEPNIANLPWKEIQDGLEKRLKANGVKIASEHYKEIKATALEVPELIISVEAYRLDDSKRYVLHIQTFLSRAVYLAKERRWLIKADVWKSSPMTYLTSIRSVSAVIPPLLTGQMDKFVLAYLQANPVGTAVSDSNTADAGSHKATKERAKSAVEQPVAEYEYVSSKNSKVFHRADCASAKRISPENLVGYNSREEAIQAGKRSCERCKP